jgi:alpha-tubulin suppressor-like RCC1 family protein
MHHSLAVREDGTVWAWGDNSYGQLGDGTVGERRDTPAPVQGLTDVVAVAAGDYHSLAMKQDGSVWAWGSNSLGQLGDMTLDNQPVPVQTQGLQGVAAIYASVDLSLAVMQDGTVWTWGGDYSVWSSPPTPPAPVPELSEVVSLSVMSPQLLALRSDGTVWEWYLEPWYSPAWPRADLTDAVGLTQSVSTTQLLRADGTVWNTGVNLHGEQGFVTPEWWSIELQQLPGLTDVMALSSEAASVYALRADGTLWSWGQNHWGTIGDGASPVHLEPTRVRMPCKLTGLASGEGGREQRRCHDD